MLLSYSLNVYNGLSCSEVEFPFRSLKISWADPEGSLIECQVSLLPR